MLESLLSLADGCLGLAWDGNQKGQRATGKMENGCTLRVLGDEQKTDLLLRIEIPNTGSE
jgi:hypothetical protein